MGLARWLVLLWFFISITMIVLKVGLEVGAGKTTVGEGCLALLADLIWYALGLALLSWGGFWS